MAFAPVVGASVGIELEVTDLTEGHARRFLERSPGVMRGWTMHHDGSTISQGYAISGLPYAVRSYKVKHDDSSSLVSPVSMGSEIVSPILDTTNGKWYDSVCYLTDWLRDTAHERAGTYTSTHVHVAAGGLPVYVLKNLLRIWRFLEAPMFRLSVGELGFHRGTVRKEYAYCRPLSSPLVIFDQNGVMRHSFDVGRLLRADTLEDFFLGYGATNPQTEPIRYHPARYCALNLLPLLTLHTVEFRTFNETLDPRTIKTWVDISKAIVTAAFSTKGLGDDDYAQLPLGYSGDFDLGMMQTLLELPETTMGNIERLWNMAGWCPFDGVKVFNSNNENLTLNFTRDAETLPPSIDGTPVMMYAPLGSGRNSEERVFVFHNRSSYRTATNNSPVSVEEGRALVRANFRQPETTVNEEEIGREPPRREPRRSPTFTYRPTPQTNIDPSHMTDEEIDENIRRARELWSAQVEQQRAAMGGQSPTSRIIAETLGTTTIPTDPNWGTWDITSVPFDELNESEDQTNV